MNVLSERTIFLNAIEQDDPLAREIYLSEACGDDKRLRSSVDALLRASDQPNHPLDRPPVAVDEGLLLTRQRGDVERQLVGTMIGPYRLMEQIGEGGFGLVFVAQQERPVRRSVALKIVKPGSGSKEIIARFEAERQAVAMMDHPNIARVFDAGLATDGRPYFVMELVRGVPITEFADAHRLTIRERLQLFQDVCAAVHHAHQKGVIHRDIKPSNVMVTLHDEKPVVKVIDFGVAKAIGQSLTDKTLYTRFFSMIGTPLYMSPEQAEMSGLDIDTRSDIYSLGVLLYELLSGATPFDRDRLDSAGLDEFRRIIREEQPPRPSKRLTTLGERMSTVSTSRCLEPSRLTSSLRGDLDWIVMKALEKDRNRRYDSAATMSADIARYLHQQPIQARPPSASYLLLKFARRNRVVLATAVAILLTMLLGTATSLWQMRAAMNERDEKEKALVEIEQFAMKITQAHRLLASAQSYAESDRLLLAMDEYDAAVEQQPKYYLPWASRGEFLARIGWWQEASASYATAIELEAPVDSPQWWGVPALFELTSNVDAKRQYTLQLQKLVASEPKLPSWEVLRNCLADENAFSQEQFAAFARQAESWLVEAERMPPDNFRPGPPPLRDGFRHGPPPEAFGNVDRRPEPPQSRGNRLGRLDDVPRLPLPVCLYITGLAHLREGSLNEAMRRLRQTQRGKGWPAVGLAHAPMAMIHHQNGDREASEDELRKSQQAVREIMDTDFNEQQATTHGGIPWFDSAEMLMLHEEASRLIRGKSDLDATILDRVRRPLQ